MKALFILTFNQKRLPHAMIAPCGGESASLITVVEPLNRNNEDALTRLLQSGSYCT